MVFALGIAAAVLTACAGQTANNSSLSAAAPAPTASAATPASPTFSPSPAAVQDNSERISLADAKKAFDAGTAVFIDVRSPEAYKIEHIKGALNITVADIDANINKIPKGKKVIAYCS